nr:MAG TPA: hypothetical protein [Caudoviricetes sp.]
MRCVSSLVDITKTNQGAPSRDALIFSCIIFHFGLHNEMQ